MRKGAPPGLSRQAVRAGGAIKAGQQKFVGFNQKNPVKPPTPGAVIQKRPSVKVTSPQALLDPEVQEVENLPDVVK